MIDQAIYNSHSLAKSVEGLENGSYKAFDKDGKEITLDKNKVEAEVARLQAVWDSQEYARKRKAEYDQLNQFEMQFDDQRDGTTTWVDAINGIKDKHPKE